jgi:hypothetical protein
MEVAANTETGVEVLWQAASVVGLLCLVSAYLVNQRGGCRPDSPRYLAANAAGAGVLAAYSAVIEEWVFVGLEGFWCVASLFALITALKAKPGPESEARMIPERRPPTSGRSEA